MPVNMSKLFGQSLHDELYVRDDVSSAISAQRKVYMNWTTLHY